MHFISMPDGSSAIELIVPEVREEYHQWCYSCTGLFQWFNVGWQMLEWSKLLIKHRIWARYAEVWTLKRTARTFVSIRMHIFPSLCCVGAVHEIIHYVLTTLLIFTLHMFEQMIQFISCVNSGWRVQRFVTNYYYNSVHKYWCCSNRHLNGNKARTNTGDHIKTKTWHQTSDTHTLHDTHANHQHFCCSQRSTFL